MNHYNLLENINRKTVSWYLVLSSLTLIFLFYLPLNFVDHTADSNSFLLSMDLILTCLLAIDLYLRFTGSIQLTHINEESTDSPINTKKSQAKSQLIFSLLTILPFEAIAFFLVDHLPVEFTLMIRCLGFSKLARFRDLAPYTNQLKKHFKFGLLTALISLAIHSITCGWILINGVNDPDFLTSYNKALYWSITTLTTVGYGDITPNSNLSRLYTMVVMLGGVTTFGFILSHFFKMMLLKDKYTKHKDDQMEKLNSFMSYYNIPTKLRSDVYTFYGHILNKDITEEDSRILNSLPNSLQEELSLFIRIKLIKKIHIFEGLSNKCLKQIAQKLEQKDFTPNSYIIKQGEQGDKMFIIAHGSVEVLSNDHIIGKLKEGQFFGEIALIEDTLRIADVKTSVYCDLYTLNKTDFIEITKNFPELKKRFKKIYVTTTGEQSRAA